MAGKSPKRRSADQTWLRPPRVVVERIESLLELGKSDTAIRNHHTMVEFDISEEQIADIRSDYEAARDWELKKRRDHKAQEEAAKSEHWRSGSLPATPSRSSPKKTSPSKSPIAAAGESSQILRGGPKTWPAEVVAHVHSLLDLGWSSSKVANHYSLLVFGITSQQVDLVKSAPISKRGAVETRFAFAWPDDLVEHVRKLILEGKTNTAILNHHSLSNASASEAHIQSVRTAIEKEAWMNASGGASAASPLKRSASKIKPPPLSRQEKELCEQLMCDGRSNAYICNFHALSNLNLQEYHVEGVRRAFYDEQDGIAVVAARHSPPSKPLAPARTYDDEERLKKEHKERLRRKTADKMMQQRMLVSPTA